jgi:hypothetical protein
MFADRPGTARTVRTWRAMTRDGGLPLGVPVVAADLAGRAARAAARLSGRPYRVDEDAALAHVLLPLVLGDDPAAADPRPVAGGGWVHVDVLAEDRELLGVLAAEAGDAEDLAVRAQECRLPVTPYRSPAASWAAPPEPSSPAAVPPVDPGAVRVLDLTAMWAGPLATAQLAAWGARVTTLEPPFRRDGLRGSPGQFAALDAGKRRVPWDLRASADRRRFEHAVGEADVLVESFSSRVMGNLGYTPGVLHRLNPGLVVVGLRAFPSGAPEAAWVAFGRGVHAASGLGVVDGRPAPAQLAYPDALAGLLTFALVLEAIAAGAPATIEVSLAAALAPLLATAGRPLAPADPALVDRLRAATDGRPGGVIVPA